LELQSSTKVSSKRNKQEKDDEKDVNDDEIDAGTMALKSLEEAELKARFTYISRPFLLSSWVKLREYQKIGLNWLVSIQTRRLNGILADEMGLGKTLQTISLLSYLASYKGIWGPHLVIVPTSCIVNWEMEIKRFCPAFKVLCYYGTAKRRKELRQGWTKTNWHHVIVTSYQLAVQDSFAFKRKKWYYLILDEAQNIKNFQSQRWQTLVNFNTQRRLLLTGTPLQNNLMELWSLLHFLMPHIFRSRKEFSYWFSNPLNNMIEGNTSRNDDIIGRLHHIIRPFVLRRLKKDVEKQMPGKYEHVVNCQLSRRQMFLYEEFMARSSTRMALKGGNYMDMMNVLMQLRKVCNHPDLFEPRSVITPFFGSPLSIIMPACVAVALKPTSPLNHVSDYIICPLWSNGCGIPSLDASVDHDTIKSESIHLLQTPQRSFIEKADGISVSGSSESQGKVSLGLQKFLNKINEKVQTEKKDVALRTATVNMLRCESSSFLVPQTLMSLVQIGLHLSKNHNETRAIISSPKELLHMIRSEQERADDMEGIINNFVFCVPRVGARRPILNANMAHHMHSTSEEKYLYSKLSKSFETYFKPFRKTSARLTSFFPDKKLIQFDAGKLQILAELMHSLKQNNHRVLIFTQMSKMLDILEAFLNLHGHTYLRLDGSTGVDQRQRMMDRFNNDSKIFCFILSTRSGGLGINLTGADTVVFYDSDWNPAMDAQAQDRAHRIGQTRDVHIYRLVTEHTIEENILVKAKQKRHLDYLVMDEGKFNTAFKPENNVGGEEENNADVFTKGGLKNILGVSDAQITPEETNEDMDENPSNREMSKEQIENAMVSLEDEDDVKAMRGAQKEVAEELQEFDEKESTKEGKDKKTEKEDDGSTKRKASEMTQGHDSKNDEDSNLDATSEQMEKEFVDWRNKVGVDKESIDASLTPTERYALRFREDIEPFYSDWYFLDQTEENDTMEEEWDVEAIELSKTEEEQRAMDDGDLLATNPKPIDLPPQIQQYHRVKSNLRADKKRRKLTGENWSMKIDGRTKYPFWYNSDTGEAVWDRPKILTELEAEDLGRKEGWCCLPSRPLSVIMEFLLAFPERIQCSSVCKRWHYAANDHSYVKHVFPVEMGALAMDPAKMDKNHYKTISDALLDSNPGDTIELGDGHYWINESTLQVDFPLRIIGDEKDPSHVIIEFGGTILWKGGAGWIEGVTFRKPRFKSEALKVSDLLQINFGGKLNMAHCVFDNQGIEGNVAVIHGNGSCGKWEDVCLRGGGKGSASKGVGLSMNSNCSLDLSKCEISNNQGTGIDCHDNSKIIMKDCKIHGNGSVGICLNGKSEGRGVDCVFTENTGGQMIMGEKCTFSDKK